MKNAKILIVEDEELVKLTIKEYLETSGYNVVGEASTGEEALQLIDMHSPDMVFMDINLKGSMDGIETAGHIYKKYNIPVVYVTAYSDEKNLERAKPTNPYGYVVKPFTDRDLISAIELSLNKFEMEKAIRKSEERYRKIFEDSLDMIYIRSTNGRFLDVNPAGVKMMGYNSREEMLKINIGKDVYINEEDRKKFEQEIAQNGFVKEREMELKKKDGTIINVLVSSSVIKDAKGNITGYRGIIRDITDQLLMQQQLLDTSEELLTANEKLKHTQAAMIQHEKLASIGQLAAGVAHELNNPIGFISSNANTLEKYFTAIKNYVDLLESVIDNIKVTPDELTSKIEQAKNYKTEKKLDFLFEDVPDLFSESKEGFQRITSIIENLRSFSRVDHSDTIKEHDLNKAIENTLVVAKNEIKYSTNVKKNLSEIPLVECHGNEINQVFLNIIVNASHAIKSQNRQEKGTIEIKTYEKEGNVYCEIEDDGPGIPQNIIDKIFDPFFTTKEVGKGTGLGLNISYDIIVNKHKGKLTVESEMGKGTTFIIMLPVQSPLKKKGNHD